MPNQSIVQKKTGRPLDGRFRTTREAMLSHDNLEVPAVIAEGVVVDAQIQQTGCRRHDRGLIADRERLTVPDFANQRAGEYVLQGRIWRVACALRAVGRRDVVRIVAELPFTRRGEVQRLSVALRDSRIR